MRKSPDAFRTISEVAQDLDLPQHVLRFWETRFSQIKPMKRGGGRRYYRPDDVELLRGIRHLLYDEGYTIKGVQRILKEQGMRHVIDAAGNEAKAVDPTAQTSANSAGDAANLAMPVQPVEPNELELDRPPLVSPNVAPQADFSSPLQSVPQTVHPQAPIAQPVHPAGAHTAVQPARQPVQPPIAHQPMPQGPVAPSASQPVAPAIVQTVMHPTSQTVVTSAPDEANTPHLQVPATSLSDPLVPTVKTSNSGIVHPAEQRQAEQEIPARLLNAPLNAPVARQAVVPEESELGQSLPHDLARGDPKFLHGESASISVADGRAQIQEDDQKSGFFTRLRGRSDAGVQEVTSVKGMPKDDVRRLQSTLFELLECKRILDQARTD